MSKRKPIIAPYQRKLSVQDVRSTETPVGIGMENEEMRRIAMRVNSLTDELEGLKPPPVDDGGKKNPIKDRGDVIGGDTAGDITNIVINGGGGKWALTVLANGIRIFREKWQQALNFFNPKISEYQFRLPIVWQVETAAIANDLKADPSHPATQANIQAHVPDTTPLALDFYTGKHSIQRFTEPVPTAFPAILGLPNTPINTRYFTLRNDVARPGDWQYYGTVDGSTDTAWHSLQDAIDFFSDTLPEGLENQTLRYNASNELEATSILLVGDGISYNRGIDVDGEIRGRQGARIDGDLQVGGHGIGQGITLWAGDDYDTAEGLQIKMTDDPVTNSYTMTIDTTGGVEAAGVILIRDADGIFRFENISDYIPAALTGGENNTVRFNASGDMEETSDFTVSSTQITAENPILLQSGNPLYFYNNLGTYFTALASPLATANATYYLPPADGTAGQVLSTDGSGQMSWETASGGGGASFESRTLSSNITLNKSDGWANYVRLTNTGADKVITFGTGFVAGDYFYFTMAQNTGVIYFYIQSKYVAFGGGGIFALWFDGTNWNNILPNQRSFSDSNVARSINLGINNSTASNGVAIGISCSAKGNLNIAFGDSVSMGTGDNQVGFGVNVNGGGGNNNTLIGEDINTSGSYNVIVGEIGNGSGSYNNLLVRNSQNPNTKSYLKGMGNGVRFLHSGEIALKIDNKNYSSTALQSHLRIVNFGATTTNATQTEIYLNDSTSADRLVIPAKSSYMIKGRMSAVQSDFSDVKHWEFSCSLLRDGSNNTSLQGTTNIAVLQESTGATTWDMLLSADNTNESLKVEVIGQASQTIYWKGIFEIIDLMLP